MTINTYWGSSKDDKTIDNHAWNIVYINSDGIEVTWQEKYGNEKTEKCIGLWENKSQYMLTWKDSKKIILEKSNINKIEYVKNSIS